MNKIASRTEDAVGCSGALDSGSGIPLTHLPTCPLAAYNQLATSAELSENVNLLWGYGLLAHGIQMIIVVVAVALFASWYIEAIRGNGGF